MKKQNQHIINQVAQGSIAEELEIEVGDILLEKHSWFIKISGPFTLYFINKLKEVLETTEEEAKVFLIPMNS